MSDRPTTSDGDAGEPDPTVTFALRAMAPPEHGDGFWDGLETLLRAEPPAPTVAVPVVAQPPPVPPPPPLAEVVPLHAARRSRPPAQWIAAAAAVLLVAVAAVVIARSSETDVKTTPAAPVTTLEEPTTVSPIMVAPPSTTKPVEVPPTTVRPAVPTSAVPRTTVPTPATTATTKPVSLTISPDGLGPLRLGMTPAQAKATGAILGYSPSLNAGCGYAGPSGPYRDGDFSALFVDLKLARFYLAEGSRLRTPQGIGYGSPRSSLDAVPGTRVERPHPYDENLTDVEITDGDAGYLFTVDNATGIVIMWSVGTRAGLDLTEGCS